jgi:DivIVA domain-containing protein
MARKRRKREEEAGFGASPEGFGDESAAGATQRGRLTPVDVQQKVFRLAFRGYNERDVDEFLDQITEDLAALHEENKRLREQIAEGGGSGTGGAAAQQQAEAVVRQAREHAARLIEEAERRSAAAGATSGGPPAPSSYLSREREFLQTLASLVQDHARRLKEEARRARPGGAGADSATGPASAVAAPATSEPEPASGPEGARQPEPATGETASSDVEGESPETSIGGASSAERPLGSEEASAENRRSKPQARITTVIPEPETASLRTGPAPASAAEGPSEAASDRSGGQDPLLSAWDSAFGGPEGEPAPSRSDPGDARERPEEPSLRELFWGEE